MRSVILRVSVIVVSVYLIVRLVSLLGEYNTAYKNYQAELKKKEELEYYIAEQKSLCTPESKSKMIEKAARERFGFAYPNEEFYTDTSGN